MKERVVILGGGAAGPKIMAKLLRTTDYDCQIDMYTDEDMISYSACGMPFYIEGLIENYRRLIVRTPQQFEEKGAHIHLGQRCIKIMPAEKKVMLEDVKTKEISYADYDKLAITTGASPYIPNIKNINLKNVFTLRKLEDAINIKDTMLQSKKAVIIGGGYIGIELLEAFVVNDIQVDLIERSSHILSIFDNDMSDMIRTHIQNTSPDKVNIITDDAVTALVGEDRAEKVVTQNGKIIDTDMVIIAAGVIPNTKIAAEAGIELGVGNTIRVNHRMQTSIKDIYAAGDCIENYHLVSRSHVWIPLGSSANKEGRCAAINISGGYDTLPGILGSSVTRYIGFTMSLTGLTERDARTHGFDVITSVTTKQDKAGYMPESENITIKLVADRRTQKILGAQAVGTGDADKRINTVASAIMADETVDDFLHLDMTYAPPYSTAIDPLLSAAIVLNNKIKSND